MFLETLKANFLILLVFVVLVGLGYWGVNSLQVEPEEFDFVESDVRPVIVNEPTGFDPSSGSSNSSNTTTEESSAVATINNSNTSTDSDSSQSQNQTSTSSSSSSSNSEYSNLISKLEKLISDNVFMKKGSRGTRVGTVQEFLNIYNGTDSKIDNDYGATTESQIRNFQRSEGLTADGQAGPDTYRKMIEWLNKQ